MMMERVCGEVRLIENPRLDFLSARSVVVKKALIVFKFKKGSPVAACKYTSFDDPAKTVKTRLPTPPILGHLEAFSVCKLANDTKVILSGGHWEFGKRFPTV